MEMKHLFWAPLRMLEHGHAQALQRLDEHAAELTALKLHVCGSSQDLRSEVRRLLAYLGTRMQPHFRAEERIVFPHLLRFMPSLRPEIRLLLREHQAFRRDLSWLKNQITCPNATARQFQALRRRALATIRRLRRHILQEQTIMGRFDPKALARITPL